MRTKYQKRKKLLSRKAWLAYARSVPYDPENATRKADADYNMGFFDDFSPELRHALWHDGTFAHAVAGILMCGGSEEEIIRRIYAHVPKQHRK